MNEEDKIELRSEEFQEVLGGVPSWIVRWGITLLSAIVVLILVGSAIFKYPDVIPAQVTITGTTPPASVVAHASGKIRELYVMDNQEVAIGEYLAVIDNPANTEDIKTLKEALGDSQEASGKDTSNLQIFKFSNRELQLGSMQSLYSQYYTTLFRYSEYKRLLYYPQKMEITKQRIAQYEKQYENLQKQYDLTEEQTQLQEKQYQRDIKLNETGVVSAEELEISRSRYLQSELSLENMQSTLDNMRIQIGQLKESLLDTKQQDTETLNELETGLQTLETQLKAAIEEWELMYVLKSPIDGKVTFTSYWTENQNVTAGSEIFSVVPGTTTHSTLNTANYVIGKALLPIARSGKVKTGQKVNIRLENFPENEFGILQGRVKNISLVPVSAGQTATGSGTAFYTIDIELPDSLTTTYKKQLPYLPNMQGRADIVTDDISLLERFFLPLKRILSESL
ncbi:MAG: HlyD family secretion protein [Tannerella sp.]|jgi:HlyD family secretion protein|nr:HlyD family secretion protein [Tannerella sp.]